MATEFNFEGRNISLPGVYSTVKSGIKNPPISLSYGNVLVIDTGSGANYGGGAGINGELSGDIDAVYPTDNIQDFRTLVKGGLWYQLAKPLFQPLSQPGVNGASTVYYVRAATTTAGLLTFNPVGGGLNGGTLEIKTKDEGLIANGSLVGSQLSKGYAYRLKAGVIDPSKFILEFYRGTYTGTASDGFPYGEVKEVNSKPITVVTSREFTDFNDLVEWATNDPQFNEYFTIGSSSSAGDGSIDADDLTTFSSYQLATGATETFGASDLTKVLETVKPLRYSFIFSDKYGANAQDTVNDQLLNHVLSVDTSFEKMIFIGGGKNETDFSGAGGSIETAQYFNSDRAVVVHGGVKLDYQLSPIKTRETDSMYTTALALGRIAGLEPQTPGTFKILPVSGLLHNLTTSEKRQGQDAGVLMIHRDTQLQNPAYTILHAINTLQNNANIINEDGTTPEISIRRIAAQLNLELQINARTQLLGNEEGSNLNTISDRVLIDFTAAYLAGKIASTTDDDIITEFRNISVSTDQDSKFITYEFKPNSPVNKLFFTGFMVE